MSKNITVIGVGRLGLGLALLIEKGGYNVCGVDIFPDYVKCLNDKTYKTKEPEYENLLKNSKNFHATTDLQEGLNFSDIIFIVVQTPNGGGDRFYDHTILSNLLVKINNHKVKNKDVIADLHKSEVFKCAEYLGVPMSIVNAKPSADLWEDQEDEKELGFTYDFIEFYTGSYLKLSEDEKKSFLDNLNNDSHKEFLNFEKKCVAVHNRNKHKIGGVVNL